VSESINRAGGLKGNASSRNIILYKTAFLDAESKAQVQAWVRTGNFGSIEGLESHRVDVTMYEATGLSRYNPFIEDGDIVVVSASQGRIGALEAVQNPGFFEFVEGDHISDLLTIAMGPSRHYDREHVYLFRFADDMTTRIAVPVDIDAVLAGDSEADLPLQSGDWLVVRGIPRYHERSTIKIEGEVRYPGIHVVKQSGSDLKSVVLNQAGGFNENAALPEARVVRKSFDEGEQEVRDPWFDWIRFIPVADRTDDQDQYFNMKTRERSGHMVVDFVALFEGDDESQNILLRPGDVIVVPTRQQIVMVSGRAGAPGAVVYNEAFSVWDYIDRAGGYGWRASKDVRVIKARTGEMKAADSALKIDPGDRIWIKEKPVRDYWSIFTQSMEVIGQVTTVVLLYVTITKN
jgi:protein involved in polysaccharide export with SLBB domain